MDGGCHHRGPVPLGRLDDDPPGLAERSAHLGHRTAYAGIGLDLGAQKLPHHPMGPALLLAGFENALVRVDEEVAGFGIDQKELLLDPESDCHVSLVRGAAHGPLSASFEPLRAVRSPP